MGCLASKPQHATGTADAGAAAAALNVPPAAGAGGGAAVVPAGGGPAAKAGEVKAALQSAPQPNFAAGDAPTQGGLPAPAEGSDGAATSPPRNHSSPTGASDSKDLFHASGRRAGQPYVGKSSTKHTLLAVDKVCASRVCVHPPVRTACRT